MAISGTVWTAALLANLAGKGFIGPELAVFCNAVGNGSAAHLIGQSFTTTDTGSVPGTGNGTGLGVTGLSTINIQASILVFGLSLFGSTGPKLSDLADAVATVCVSQMSSTAVLTSTHSPVYIGNGTVDIGSITVSGSSWASSIQSLAPGFLGPDWPNLCTIIGTACANEISASGTGTVTITGTGGPPVPGAGTGSGIIS